MAPRLAKLLRKAMTITVEDQIEYCNRTIQVGPHTLVVTCASLDASVPRLRSKYKEWTLKHGGHIIWSCTPSMSSYLVASKVANERRVLELGSGMGVCGLIAHKTGASLVVLTDGDETTMSRLHENISTNVGFSGEAKVEDAEMESDQSDNRPAYARVLRWGDTTAVQDLMEDLETGEFDLVIGSDLIYQEHTKKHQALALIDTKSRDLFVTAAAALREGGSFVLAHEIRDSVEEVLATISKHALSNGFGCPQMVRSEESPGRIVLLLPYLGNKDGWQEGKNDNSDTATEGWIELMSLLQALGLVQTKKDSW